MLQLHLGLVVLQMALPGLKGFAHPPEVVLCLQLSLCPLQLLLASSPEEPAPDNLSQHQLLSLLAQAVCCFLYKPAGQS